MIDVATTIVRLVGDRYENGKVDRPVYRAREAIAQDAVDNFGHEVSDTSQSHGELNAWLSRYLKMEFA